MNVEISRTSANAHKMNGRKKYSLRHDKNAQGFFVVVGRSYPQHNDKLIGVHSLWTISICELSGKMLRRSE